MKNAYFIWCQKSKRKQYMHDFIQIPANSQELGQVLNIVTCGTQTDRGDSLGIDAKLPNH